MIDERRILIAIPTYNEAGNIERLLEQVRSQRGDVDIVVIDDNSPDGTGNVVEALSERLSVKVAHRPAKLGVGSAHKFAMWYAIDHGYTHLLMMDGDFAHNPADVGKMLAQADAADMVIGSRYVEGGGLDGWPFHRRLITYAAHWLTTLLLKLPYDCTGGFRLYNVARLKRVDYERIHSDGYALMIEMLYQVRRSGLSVQEVPIIAGSRHIGKSKISRTEVLNAVKTLFRLSLRRLKEGGFPRAGGS